MRLRDRFWIRGWTLHGLVNTVLACCAGVVLVRTVDSESGRTVGWSFAAASRFPRPGR